MLILRIFRHNKYYSGLTRNSQQNLNILNLDKPYSGNERRNKHILELGKEKESKQRKSKSFQWNAGSIGLLVVPAIAFSLGCWQAYRLQWKLRLIENLESRLNEASIELPTHDLSLLDTLEYQRVRISGEFIHDREFVITPRGRFDKGHSQKDAGSLLSQNDLSSHGGHVITPFKLYGTNTIIMVNRGWVPAHKITRNSRIKDEPRGVVSLEAIVRKSEKRPQFVGKNIPEQGVWFYKDFNQMARQCAAAPVYVEAVHESTLPNGPIGGQTNISIRNEHLSYLITWYTLCAVTIAMWVARFRR